MATQTVEFRAVTGQTVTAKLFTAGSDTEVASVSATEATNRKGTYAAAFTDVAAGEYQLLAFNATSIPLASWWVTLTLTTATFQVYEKTQEVAGTGTGARTVTITVNDGTTVLQNARVRLTNGGDTYTALTNVSGVATFNLDDATWIVSITKGGYSFAGASLVVDGTETVTYSMSLVVITPSSVDKVTGYWTVLDETGSAAASVVVTIKARQPLRGGAGLIHDAGERTATSNGSGLVQFTNLIPGWRYAVVANDDYVADFVVPADAVTSVELGSIVARLP